MECYQASAPANLMLLGEHAVLNNKRAIVFSINKRITVRLLPRSDRRIIIKSSIGCVEFTIEEIICNQSFKFVIESISYYQKKLVRGFELIITADFSHQLGWGSSAAVTVATVAVLEQFINFGIMYGLSLDDLNYNIGFRKELFLKARYIVNKVQKMSSGADVAAAVYGGIIMYQQNPPYILGKLEKKIPILLVYTGYKTLTTEVISRVKQLYLRYPNIINQLYNTIDISVGECFTFIAQENWLQVGGILKIQQGIMNSLNLSTGLINHLIDRLSTNPDVCGVKISGSGMGDSIIAVIQDVPDIILEYDLLKLSSQEVEVCFKGFCYE
ncbi:mevalonate kinase family protein [Rickettsia endosymbiont of Cardiosporidium cionae]|uniref:mevalonate kinase family protein n=1 Tax=Rickettsia endosymbiont of Cardiosporidium cionae TaxID=2777155 RepID=UPI0018933139|nr:hypothetical protein [Rickettsia endosymbiont of Cardiosporidium cionae]KAF8818736.1 hypothetical protein IHI24_000462 [Rickettsia endosymbiont of Cardiosporidium cionae]